MITFTMTSRITAPMKARSMAPSRPPPSANAMPTYAKTGGTGKYEGLAGGGTYMYEGLTDKLFGGRYKGRLVLP